MRRLQRQPLLQQSPRQAEAFKAALANGVVGLVGAYAVTHQPVGNGKGQVNAGVGARIELTSAQQTEQRPRPAVAQTGRVARTADQGELAASGVAQVIGPHQPRAARGAVLVGDQLAIDAERAAQARGTQGQRFDGELHRLAQ